MIKIIYSFDVNNITKGDMKRVAENIEIYLDTMTSVFVIPDEVVDKSKYFYKSIKVVRELIKELEKGNRDVWIDPDDYTERYDSLEELI